MLLLALFKYPHEKHFLYFLVGQHFTKMAHAAMLGPLFLFHALQMVSIATVCTDKCGLAVVGYFFFTKANTPIIKIINIIDIRVDTLMLFMLMFAVT